LFIAGTFVCVTGSAGRGAELAQRKAAAAGNIDEARKAIAGALKWAEIDKADRQICLDGERTKNGKDHTIPLSRAAWDLIQAAPRLAGSKFVFTTTGNTPISGWSRAKAKID
jgi:integrase